MKLDAEGIDGAVASVSDRLRPEDRFDLRQELALKLLEGKCRIEGLRDCARNWAMNLARDEKAQREIRASGPRPYRRQKTNWEPTWYPPHADAREGDWLTCAGARVMRISESRSTLNHVEEAMVAIIDHRRR